MSHHVDTLSIHTLNQSVGSCCLQCGEATHTILIVIGFTRPEIELGIYNTQGEHNTIIMNYELAPSNLNHSASMDTLPYLNVGEMKQHSYLFFKQTEHERTVTLLYRYFFTTYAFTMI